MFKHGKNPEPFADTINYLINLNDYSFINLNFLVVMFLLIVLIITTVILRKKYSEEKNEL